MSSKSRSVSVYNRTQQTLMASEVTVADSYLRRLVGLLGRPPGWARPERGLWIIPSNAVHTLGMMFPIDVVFLDGGNQVVRTQEFLRPFRVSRICLDAQSVLELSPRTISRSRTRVGDHLEIIPAE